ncbi:MAG: hypothetical protein QXD50_00725 [Desulfurococcaceae archaeon]
MIDVEYPIIVYWEPSLLLTVEEQLIIKHRGCPICGSKNIQIIQHEKLHKNTSNSIQGDLFVYICSNCGSINKLRFIYKSPIEENSLIEDFIFVFKQLLYESANSLIPDYSEFLNKITLIYDEVKTNKPQVIKDILSFIASEIQKAYSEITGDKRIDDIRTFNRLKLLLAFITKLPFEDYNYILNTLPPNIREALRRNLGN